MNNARIMIIKKGNTGYKIITNKHNEYFAMLDLKAYPYNIIAATPFARYPMEELSAAFHELGLYLVLSYSIILTSLINHSLRLEIDIQ